GVWTNQLRRIGESSDELERAQNVLDPHSLTIGFARRFATYKRATLILGDPTRLQRILNDTSRPVQILFAGKAHPADLQGQSFLQAVFQATRDADLQGKIIFLEDY